MDVVSVRQDDVERIDIINGQAEVIGLVTKAAPKKETGHADVLARRRAVNIIASVFHDIVDVVPDLALQFHE